MADAPIRVIDGPLLRSLEAKAGLIEHPKRVLRRFHVHMVGQTGQMVRENKHGGTHRGVHWPWFADQYTRKTDGQVVPAEGGVRKIRGRGNVKGRLRSSGGTKKRVTRQSNLNRLTGRAAIEIGTAIHITDQEMLMGTSLDYVVRLDQLREWLFFTDDDLRQLQLLLLKALEEAVR
jgi:hypothetical protein